MAMREGTSYEGYVRNADSSIICIQCIEGRHSECPQDDDDSTCLEGYCCECGCDLTDDDTARNAKALDAIQEMLRDPEWGVDMLEDIAELVKATGRVVENYPDGRPTWARH